jgi:two-component system, LytTR family, sensor histidine kinase AlgZ
MHPLLGDRARLGLYLLTFVLVGAILALLLVPSAAMGLGEALALAVPLALLLGFICLSAFYLCRSVPLASTDLPRLVGTQALAAAVASSIWVLAGLALAEVLGATLLVPGVEDRFAAAVPLLAATGALFYLLAGAVHYALLAIARSHAAETRALELAVLSREAELKALRAQLQPHFLFNALNSISALTTANPEGARQMCVLLGDFLRQSLRLGAKETVPLADELANTERFLAVEKVRFGARLRTEVRIDDGARECLVPPLLLQPLVENAITHGIAGLLEGGTLSIEARLRGTELRICVLNPRDPEAPRRAGEGMGLDNVRRRLDALFGREARTEVRREADRFRVELTLPARVAS